MKTLRKFKQLRTVNRDAMLSLQFSVLGILLCIFCLVGTTWAWFTSNQTVDAQTVKSASLEIYPDSISVKQEIYSVYTTTTENEDGSTTIEESLSSSLTPTDFTPSGNNRAFSFKAEANTLYRVNVKWGGSAKSKFLVIDTKDGKYYTTDKEQFDIVLSARDDNVNIYVSWGEKPAGKRSGRWFGNGYIDKPDTKTTTIPASTVGEGTSGDTPSAGTDTAGTVKTDNNASSNVTNNVTTSDSSNASNVTADSSNTSSGTMPSSNASSGTTPSSNTSSGTTPSNNASSGTTPSSNAPSGTMPSSNASSSGGGESSGSSAPSAPAGGDGGGTTE